jgi:hypothetical protein
MNREIVCVTPVAAIFTKPRFYPGVALRMAAGRVFPEDKGVPRSGQRSLLDI